MVAVSRDGIDKSRTLGREAHPSCCGWPTRPAADESCGLGPSWTPPARGGSATRSAGPGGRRPGEDAAEPFLVGPLPDVLGRDRARFAGRRTLVVGAGHSAAGTLLAVGQRHATH